MLFMNFPDNKKEKIVYWFGTSNTKVEKLTDDFIELFSLSWKTEPPKKVGWYWTKRGNSESEIVKVYSIDNELYVWTVTSEQDHDLKEFDLWLGPIPTPELPEQKG